MPVRVRPFATLRRHLGDGEVTVRADGATLRAALARLERDNPRAAGTVLDGDGELRPTVTVLLNGRRVDPATIGEVRLADGDVIGLTPPLTGG